MFIDGLLVFIDGLLEVWVDVSVALIVGKSERCNVVDGDDSSDDDDYNNDDDYDDGDDDDDDDVRNGIQDKLSVTIHQNTIHG